MSLVMLIEDEPVLRSSMARGLARLPNVEVIDASLFRDAVRLLDAERPDLIVSDLDLPDGSGVEILNVLDAMGLRVPVIFVTAYLGSFRGQLPNRSDVEVYEKPLPLVKLREVVMRHLDVDHGGAGHESPFSLADYLQLACMGRHSVVLEVMLRGDPVGRIVVVRGQVWSASAGAESGEDAVATLAFGTAGASTMVRRRAGAPGPRDVQRPWQHILLNAARVHDEALRDQGRGGPAASAERSPAASAERGPAGSAERRPRGSGRPSSPGIPASSGRGSFRSGPLPESRPPESRPAHGDRPTPSPPPSRPPAPPGSPLRLLRPDLPRIDRPEGGRPPLPAAPRPGPAAPSRIGPAEAPAPRPVLRPAPPPPVIDPPPLDPSQAPPPAPPPADDEEDFATLMDRGLDAMLARDYATAWQWLQRADRRQPGVPTVLANLARLRQLGFGDPE